MATTENPIFNGHIVIGIECYETGHSKYGDSWITNVSWRAYLKADSYGNIESTALKGWRLLVNSQQVDSGSNYISVSPNSTITLASGIFSYIRGSALATISYPIDVNFHQEFKITYGGVGYDSYTLESTVNLSVIMNKAELTSGANFTDIGNLSITYSNGENVSNLSLCVSSEKNPDSRICDWISISASSTSYSGAVSTTFRDYLRNTYLYNTTSRSCYYVLRTTFSNGSVDYSYLLTTVSLDSPALSITADVYDINPVTLAITGDKYTLVRFASNAEYTFNVVSTPSGAGISSAYVQNGNTKLTAAPSGVIGNVEDGYFYFSARDTRGLSDSITLARNVLEYVKLTCNVEASTELSNETSTEAITTIKINGNYFNGSFGAVDNELKIEVKHTQNDGTMGDWVELTDGLVPILNGNTYTMNMTVSGFDYSQKFEFYFRVSDKLMTVEAEPFTLRVLPIFDWSEEDFNFNVPVNMNQNTVLRYNKDANNVVLSSGDSGKIYLRPNGTDNTTYETVINEDGSMKVSGNLDATGITINGEPLKIESDAPIPASYIVETGQEDMGSNGTWFWEKWSDGKAVCWGQRNFGAMSLYSNLTFMASPSFRQTFPTGLFSEIPKMIQITPDACLSNAYEECPVWISYSGTVGASINDTFNFKFCSIVNGLSISYANFYVIGRWK